jgi:hypothetical protein
MVASRDLGETGPISSIAGPHVGRSGRANGGELAPLRVDGGRPCPVNGFLSGRTKGHQFEHAWTESRVGAVLGDHSSDSRTDPRHSGTDCDVGGCGRDAELAGSFTSSDDRKGHDPPLNWRRATANYL